MGVYQADGGSGEGTVMPLPVKVILGVLLFNLFYIWVVLISARVGREGIALAVAAATVIFALIVTTVVVGLMIFGVI